MYNMKLNIAMGIIVQLSWNDELAFSFINKIKKAAIKMANNGEFFMTNLALTTYAIGHSSPFLPP